MELLFDDPGAGQVTAWLAPAALPDCSRQQQEPAGNREHGSGPQPLDRVPVKVFCNYYLTVISRLRNQGSGSGKFAWFCWFFCSITVSLYFTGCQLQWSYLLRPLLAVTIMWPYSHCLQILLLWAIWQLQVWLFFSGMLIYFGVLILTGEIRIYEVRHFAEIANCSLPRIYLC